jgi:hypothetical protein
MIAVRTMKNSQHEKLTGAHQIMRHIQAFWIDGDAGMRTMTLKMLDTRKA